VWFGYTNNQVAVLDGDRIQVFGPRDGLHIGNIMAIYGRGGMIWIGGEFGLQVYDQGRILDIKAIDDELLRGISGIIETANGDLWLNGLSGIFHIRQADLYRALTALDYRVKGERFSKEDGLPGFATQIRPLPTVIESGDGRLWFAQSDGVVWLDPACAEKIVMTPPVTIQSISADDKTYDIVLPLRLPAHTASVQITYTAVSLSAPTAIRYRYQLNGIDAAWHEVLTSSAITYRNLGPAAYHFRVQASDTNGSWSTKVETLDFTILPAYYQALWFRLLLLTVFLGLLMLAYRLRLQQLSRQYSIRLEARVEERTRVARELHDTLLQGFHGVIYRFQAARDMLPRRTDEAIEALEGALERAEQAVAEGRDAIHDLRSSTLVANELAQAVTALGQEMSRELDSDHGAAQFHVVVEGTPRDLHPTLRDEVYAIVREAVRNAFRHARAHHIEVEIRYSGNALQLRVRDDGKGVDPDIVAQGRSGHFGVPGMRERATRIGGSLDVWTATGTGTEIALSIPGSIAYGRASTGRILKLFGKKATEL
jgi:signal transduction histidine kinase